MFRRSPKDRRGFTLVELVVVIVVLGVLAVTVISRMLGSDSFDAAAARDQIVSLVRASQQKALGRRDVSLTLQPAGDALQATLEALDAGGDPLVLESRTIPARGLGIGYALDTASCVTGGLTALNTPLDLRFEAPGNLVSVNGSPLPDAGMRICIDENPALSLCISATGFAYTGNCNP
ncbi:MAG: prepilin-type N-terminal cleavage/methylation domain-containing protein [Pseudomonadota bacterium]|nr:prepilin-type N-terminal cleavage/methylation domain-containing protein [Pseudomonadota bacterium]